MCVLIQIVYIIFLSNKQNKEHPIWNGNHLLKFSKSNIQLNYNEQFIYQVLESERKSMFRWEMMKKSEKENLWFVFHSKKLMEWDQGWSVVEQESKTWVLLALVQCLISVIRRGSLICRPCSWRELNFWPGHWYHTCQRESLVWTYTKLIFNACKQTSIQKCLAMKYVSSIYD